MKNRERYEKEILEIACAGERISIKDGKLVACSASHCGDCEFGNPAGGCEDNIKHWCESEYVEPPVDWRKVAVDTPILVRDKEDDKWIKRYFAKFEKGHVFTWCDGATSWSNSDSTFICKVNSWKYAKLAEEEHGNPTRLPCQVDDKIYAIVHDYEKDTEVIEESRIIRVTQNVNGWFFESLINIPAFRSHDFGKVVFLTRKAAEAKLKEMEDSNDGE